MNQLDLDYLNLVRDILENGTQKKTRNGEVLSVFGRTIKYSFKDGKFPLLTTKKMALKTMTTELLWFLRGDTNIKYLVNNGCHIWDGDAWKRFSSVRKSMLMLKPPASEDKLREYIEWYEQITTQEEFINKIKTDDEFAKKWGELGPVYGKQWRSWSGASYVHPPSDKEESIEQQWYRMGHNSVANKTVDQIANVINLLKTDPDSRRMIVNAYNVGEIGQMVLPPCHMMFQFYTRELSVKERLFFVNKSNEEYEKALANKTQYESIGLDFELALTSRMNELNVPTRAISLRWDQCSVDVGLGLPFNIASYALLLEIIAKEVNMIPEELIGDLGDCHIYNNHIDGLKEQLTRTPYELPTIKFSSWYLNANSEKQSSTVFDEWILSLMFSDFVLENYQSHPSIKLPLSN
jgi:thymidylate synthase